MDFSLTSVIGLTAATLTTIAYVPQVYKTWHAKSSKDLSLAMLLLFSTGVLLWLIYGWLVKDWPVILANAATLLLTGGLLVLWFKYREQ
ncbi:SemiSWEET transporter [Hymenobacter sp. BT175]|uniref:SemiSWEET family sugar transporter n=1 Tax=Hymenobacter translucens TaxID=2886507 RepID=UPI001D0F421A|nr:SemiSWEET transporter [Hymenobacter translucens]MCC2548620.1 SemiSWEET transporter [Hymenobacter translucens]